MNTKNVKKNPNNNAPKTKNGYITYNNRNIGLTIKVPDDWMEVKRTSFPDLEIDDNTLSIFVVDKNAALTIIFSGYCEGKYFKKFINKMSFADYKVLYENGLEIDKKYIKQIVIETNGRKVMNNFCLINDMIVNFTINIDPHNKIFNHDELVKDKYFKIMNDLLMTIVVSEPKNPPIYQETIIPETEEEKGAPVEIEPTPITKNFAQTLIEKDCQYRRIVMPNFYLKYLYTKGNDDTNLSIVNSEIYFRGINDCFRYIKVDANLSTKIAAILNNHIVDLLAMNNTVKETESDSYWLMKLANNYIYIDMNEQNSSFLSNILKEIISVLDSQKQYDFMKYDICPKIPEIQEGYEELPNEDVIEEESTPVLTVVDQPQMEPVSKNEAKPVLFVDAMPETEPQSNALAVEKVENEPGASVSPQEPSLEAIDDEDKGETVEYDINDFQEYYHNVDGYASFKFIFPKNSGNKVVKEFNVFDIEKDDNVTYRIFIFKCENAEKYETKLEDWMNKNIKSNATTLRESYSSTTDNGVDIKTYILENGKFYKSVYIFGYLICVSSFDEDDHLLYANIALDNVEIGEDDKAFIEVYDRKINSINTLIAQGIPYLDTLPPIMSSYEVRGKTLEEIAKRAIVLCITCNFANDIINNKKKRYLKDSKKFFNKLLDSFNVRDAMTADERKLFEKMDQNLAVQISWQFEGYVILLWTLGLIEEIEFPDVVTDSNAVTSIVSSCNNYREFIEKCELRDVYEVLDLADLTYRYNWYCTEAYINKEEPIINREIVIERYRALVWLLSDVKWDKVQLES